MRLIDADALTKALADLWYDGKITITGVAVADLIDNAPTVEAVEVVRCKDCKYWQDNQEGHYPNELCPWDKGETPDGDDFCSYGERSEE